MRFGICSDVSRLELIKNLGFVYAEANLSSLSKMTDEEFEALCAEAERTNISFEAANGFCRSDLKLSCDIDLDMIRTYSEKALARARRLGCEVVVVGSGGARNVVEGYDRSEAEENFKKALCTIADVAAQLGMKVAIEPLNKYDCNLVNTLEDAAKICEDIDRENIGFIVDIYHVYKNGEDIRDILKYGKYIMHVHIARMNDDRGAPTLEDAEMMKNVIGLLDQIGYRGRLSLEASCKPDFDTASSKYAELLRSVKVI